MTDSMRNRVKGALVGAMIADSLAMPTHWMYGGTRQVQEIYGKQGVTSYVKPVEKLQGSIMSKSNTGGAGRGSYDGDLVGTQIFHGKKEFWAPGSNYFYHNLLNSGDNTLETTLMQRFIDIIGRSGAEFGFDFSEKKAQEVIIDDYVNFLTTPDTHRDSYCGTSHRMFFENLLNRGKDKFNCGDNDNHNVDAIDALVTLIPLCLISKDEDLVATNISSISAIFRKSSQIPQFAKIFTTLLRAVVVNGDLPSVIAGQVSYDLFKSKARKMKPSNQMRSFAEDSFSVKELVKDPDQMTACYLSQSFMAILQMIHKYSDFSHLKTDLTNEQKTEMFRNSVLANANRGGENVNSGVVLGAVMGGFCGFSNLPQDLTDNLLSHSPQERESVFESIEEFLNTIPLLN